MLNIDDIKNTIICNDCLEVMKQLPDKCVDLVLTDPPYGIGFDTEKESMSAMLRVDGTQRICEKWSNPAPKYYPKGDWDNKPMSEEYFVEIKRISKNQIVWGGNYFSLPQTGGWLIWDKGVVMPTLSKCELAWTSFLGHTEIIRYLWAGFRKEKPEERYHTTQKPVDVMLWCLSLIDNAEIVLDPFLGSGTTAVACYRTRRNYIGIEISPEYCKIAEKRIQQEKDKLALFNGLEAS